MASVSALPADPILERRALVQATARRSLSRRKATSQLMLGVSGLALVVASAVLVWILYLLIDRGAHWWSIAFFTQVPQYPTILQPNAVGGISTALVGSAVIDGIAVAMAVPIGVVGGLLLADADNVFVNTLRRIVEIATGLPSILFGLFVYGIMILKWNLGFAGIDGSVALAILMIPVIMKASELAFRAVPPMLSEAGLALGLSKSTVARRIVTPTATPGLLTAVLLSTSRAVGETAPLLFLIGNTYVVQWDPTKPQTALPMSVFGAFLDGQAPAQRAEAWGTALVLAVAALALNLGSRGLTAFLRRERH